MYAEFAGAPRVVESGPGRVLSLTMLMMLLRLLRGHPHPLLEPMLLLLLLLLRGHPHPLLELMLLLPFLHIRVCPKSTAIQHGHGRH